MPPDSPEPAPLEEDFGKFFDELSALGGKPPPATFGSAAPAEPPAPDPAASPVVAADPPAPDPAAPPVVAADPPAPDPAAPPPAPEPPKPAPAQTEELLERFVRTMEARQPAAPAPAAAQPAAMYNDDETKALSEFEKDYPDVAKALQLVLRGVVTHNDAQVNQRLAQALGPQIANIRAVQADHQLMALRQAIPDYDQVRDTVVDWALKDPNIPGYLREAYKGVIEQGDVTDITDLVGRWRQVSGKAIPARPAAPAARVNELSEAAKQAAESLAPVVSKRTVTAPSTPTSFDDAFEAAAAAATKA